jgi:hypothetical protein
MIDAAQYRTANVHLVRAGQAKGEPGDNDWPWTEEPELLAAALVAVEEQIPGSVSSLARSLGLARAFEGLVGVSVSSSLVAEQHEKSTGAMLSIVGRSDAETMS